MNARLLLESSLDIQKMSTDGEFFVARFLDGTYVANDNSHVWAMRGQRCIGCVDVYGYDANVDMANYLGHQAPGLVHHDDAQTEENPSLYGGYSYIRAAMSAFDQVQQALGDEGFDPGEFGFQLDADFDEGAEALQSTARRLGGKQLFGTTPEEFGDEPEEEQDLPEAVYSMQRMAQQAARRIFDRHRDAILAADYAHRLPPEVHQAILKGCPSEARGTVAELIVGLAHDAETAGDTDLPEGFIKRTPLRNLRQGDELQSKVAIWRVIGPGPQRIRVKCVSSRGGRHRPGDENVWDYKLPTSIIAHRTPPGDWEHFHGPDSKVDLPESNVQKFGQLFE